MDNTTNNSLYSKFYYSGHLDKDRPALWFYEQVSKKFFKPGRILDYGCGYGHMVKRLSKHFTADGLDISENALVEASKIAQACSFFQSTKNIKTSSYSGIISLHVIEHISDNDLINLLKEWKRILVPRGRIICVTPDKGGKGNRLKGDDWSGFKDPTHINLKSHQEWIVFFQKADFKVIKTGTDGLWNFPYNRKLPFFFDFLLHATHTIVQFISGRLILKSGSGESSVFLLRKNK